MLMRSFRTKFIVKTLPQLHFAPTSAYSGCESRFILNFYQDHFGGESITKKGPKGRFLKNYESNY